MNFRHRTGRENATDFRRLPCRARVRTVRTGMQLFAGQEAGKSEMQIVKVNTRGTGFRHDEPRRLCALAVAAVGGEHPRPGPSVSISRAFTFWTEVDQPVQRLQRAKE
jgi:hypothetical protein